MAIITVSQQLGSLGTDIAHKLAKVLSSSVLDKQKLMPMMAEQGVTDLEMFDEKKLNLWDTIAMDRFMYIHALQMAVYRFARKGDCVIIGRGGQFLLGQVPGVLKVNVVAPFDLRLARVEVRNGCSRSEAEMLVRHSDEQRLGYHSFFFDIDCDAAELYDLVINTANLSVDGAVELIRGALAAEAVETSRDATNHRLDDFCLGQEVMRNIRCNKRITSPYLNAQVKDGVVTLNGGVLNRPELDVCEHAARETSGVKGVINNINFINSWGVA
jgi:cytidylate kinase